MTRRTARASVTAVLLATMLAACGGSSGHGGRGNGGAGPTGSANSTDNANVGAGKYGTVLYGKLPAAGTAMRGGTLSVSQLSGQTPTYIFPIIPGASSSTATVGLVENLFMPLYAGPVGAEPKVNYALSFAKDPPVVSDHDKRYTIHLKSGLKWANGAPMDANDVLFWYDLTRAAVTEAASNWSNYVPGRFPTDVSAATAPNQHTIVFTLKTSYNPAYFLLNQLQITNNAVYPLPSTDWNLTGPGRHTADWSDPAVAEKIYDYLNSQGQKLSTFATNPLWKDVSGPFKLTRFSTTNGSYALAPNDRYGGSPRPMASQVDVNTYTSGTAALTALEGGNLDVDYGVDPSVINAVEGAESEGVDLFGGPAWASFGGIINFRDATDHFDKVISQHYVREAIDMLIDQPAIIKGFYKGAAVTSYGPVPSAPASPYTPVDAAKAPYPFDPAKSARLLAGHGWKVAPGGQTTCQKPGTGAGECGQGIPKGTPIKFVWANQPQTASSTGVLESEALASQAKRSAGIDIELVTKSFNFLISQWVNTSASGFADRNDWGVNNFGGGLQLYYPTQDNSDNHGGSATTPSSGFNIGSYNSSTANRLIHNSVFSGDPAAVKREASYLEGDLPEFYFPSPDYLVAVNTRKVGSSAEGWLPLTQELLLPQYWYSVK